MQFRNRSPAALPEINLIPMLNVLMGILAFFVMITMTLTVQQGVEVPLPDRPDAANQPDVDLFVVSLTTQGLSLNDQPIAEAALLQQVERYLTTNPQGVVVLEAAPDLPYELVVQWLGKLQDVSGDRVSLAIDPAS